MVEEKTPEETHTRRRKSPEVRRDEISSAALRLFARQGFERTTTREIAAEAGIAEGTIYKYFTSKQDILFSFVTGLVIAPLTQLFEEHGTDDRATIRAFIVSRFTLWSRWYPMMKVFISEALFNPDLAQAFHQNLARPALEIIQAYITRRIAAGAFRPVDPRFAARALIGHLLTYFLLWHSMLGEEGDPHTNDALIDELTDLYLYGIQHCEART
jgi:AcrR family transcriptional regulator